MWVDSDLPNVVRGDHVLQLCLNNAHVLPFTRHTPQVPCLNPLLQWVLALLLIKRDVYAGPPAHVATADHLAIDHHQGERSQVELRPVATAAQVDRDHRGLTAQARPVNLFKLPFKDCRIDIGGSNRVISARQLRFKLGNLHGIACI